MSVEQSPQAEVERRIRLFYETTASYIERPPANDVYFASFAQGLLEACDDSETGVEAVVHEAIASRRCSSSQMFKQFLDKMQFNRIDDPSYPFEYATPGAWRSVFAQMAQNNHEREEFLKDVTHHVLSSTVVPRQIAVPLVAAVYTDRFEPPLTLIDYGAGAGIGDVHLAGRWGFNPLKEIIFEDDELDDDSRNIACAELQVAANVFPNLAFQKILGVDKQDPPTAESLARIRSSSHYPSEWALIENREHFDALIATTTEAVELVWNADMQTTGRLPQTPPQGFDIGFASTWFYQYKSEEIEGILGNCLSNISEKGIFILQDFAEPSSSNPIGVRFRDNWFPPDVSHPYQTMVYDMQHPEDGFRTFFSWTDGRPSRVKVSRYAAAKLLAAL